MGRGVKQGCKAGVVGFVRGDARNKTPAGEKGYTEICASYAKLGVDRVGLG
jgi:hypothetical protein